MPAQDATLSAACSEADQLMGFLYACPVGLLEISEAGEVLMINPMAMQLLNRLSSLPCMNFYYLLERCAPELRNLKDAFEAPQGTICENHRIVSDLEQSGVDALQSSVLSCTLIKLTPDRFMVSLHDISRQVHQEQKLKEAESWFSTLLSTGGEFGVASLDAQGRFESVGASAVSQTGFSEKELQGKPLAFLSASHPSSASVATERQLSVAARDGWHLQEDWLRLKAGNKLWCQRLVAVRHCVEQERDSGVAGYTVIFRSGDKPGPDISQLRRLLTRDHLTNAYNRMHFYEAAEKERAQARRTGQPLSLIAIDVDFFKKVNDVHGHTSGDRVLQEFVTRCDALLRPTDVLARTGGEEFTILLPHTDLETARDLADQLRKTIESTPFPLEVADVRVTGSFGCAEMNLDWDFKKTLAEADAALYQAKTAGRNQVVTVLRKAS